MWKLLMSSTAATLILSANSFNLEDFIKKNIVTNPNVKVESVKLIEKRDVPYAKGWKAYMFVMNLKYKNRHDAFPETIFVNEEKGLVTQSLMNYKKKIDYKYALKPKLPDSFYDEKHLVAGNKNAKHKIVLFSDPECPFCRMQVPEIIKAAKDNPDKLAVYYYHMPLMQIHPAAFTLTKIMEYLQKKGEHDKAFKMYRADVAGMKDEKKIIEKVNQQFGLNLTQKDINKKEIIDAIKEDMKSAASMMVRGTPTIYYDGEFDESHEKYKEAIKK